MRIKTKPISCLIVSAFVVIGCAATPRAADQQPDFSIAMGRFIDGMGRGDADTYLLLAAARTTEQRAIANDLLAAELAFQSAAAGRYGEMNRNLSTITSPDMQRIVSKRLRDAGMPVRSNLEVR